MISDEKKEMQLWPGSLCRAYDDEHDTDQLPHQNLKMSLSPAVATTGRVINPTPLC